MPAPSEPHGRVWLAMAEHSGNTGYVSGSTYADAATLLLTLLGAGLLLVGVVFVVVKMRR